MMSLALGLFTQVGDFEPHGPLVLIFLCGNGIASLPNVGPSTCVRRDICYH